MYILKCFKLQQSFINVTLISVTSMRGVKLFVTISQLAHEQTLITAIKICPVGQNFSHGKNLFLQVKKFAHG